LYAALVVTSLVAGVASSGVQGNPDKDVLSISAPFEFTSHDPAKDGYIYSRMQVAETLTQANTQGEVQPLLATEWHVDNGHKTWTLTLRDGVTFHDGSPMDAVAVANSLNIAFAKPGPLQKAPIVGISAEGGKVVIKLEKPYSPLLATLAHYSTVILAPTAYDEAQQAIAIQATGPYQVEEFAPPHKLRVRQFAGYWGGRPGIVAAEYLTGHRAESRALQAKSGQADIVYTLDPASLNLLERESTVTVHSDHIPRTILVKVNSGHPFLKDVKARQALSLAIDRTGISNSIIRVPGSEANQLVPSALADWHVKALPPASQNREKAKQLLMELGWQDSESGTLVRDSQPFELTLITYADRPELTVVATALQAQWQELGVKVNVSVGNSSDIPRMHQDGSLELALIARNFGLIPDPLAVIQADFADAKGGDWGGMNWDNAEVRELLTRLPEETDPAAYRQASQRVAGILAESLPLIPVTFYTQQTAVNQRVKNFRFDPFERSYFISEMELAQ